MVMTMTAVVMMLGVVVMVSREYSNLWALWPLPGDPGPWKVGRCTSGLGRSGWWMGLVMLMMRFMMVIIRMMMTMMKYPDERMTVPLSAITRIGGEFVLEKNNSSSSLFWPVWSLWSCDDWLSLWTLQPARSAEPALVVKLLWYVGTLEGAKAWIVENMNICQIFWKTKHFPFLPVAFLIKT